MKKIKVAALMMCFVAVGMMFTSCQKNEDLIIGKWKLVKIVEDNRTITEGEEIGSIWEFKADNTMSMAIPGYEQYAIDGTYAIDDDVLTLTMFGESTTVNIEKLNKSKMVLSDPDKPSDITEFEKI